MTPKQLPKWATRVLAVVLLAADYLAHAKGLIPATLVWHRIHVLGALNSIVLAGAAVGLNGPALWPQLAALLGNPPGTATAVSPPKS